MAKGFALPVGVDKSGGAATVEDTFDLDKILRLALSPGDDDNPFQQLGLDERIIFNVNDPAARGLARASIEAILRKYADRVEIDPNNPIQFSVVESGRLDVSFKYIDLDTGNVNDFRTTI